MNDKVKQGQAKYRETKRTYAHVLNSPEGEHVLADLYLRFGGTTLKKHDGVIDPNASIAAAGANEVLLYINSMRNDNAVD
jgi:hypothetical protein